MIPIATDRYLFSTLDELYDTAAQLPETEAGQIYAAPPDDDRFDRIGWRRALYLDDRENPVGDVSANDDHYHVHEYGDVIEAVASGLDRYDDTVTPKGHVALSNAGHLMSAYIDFDGIEAAPTDDDVIDLGLKIRTGHTGFHGLKYDVGAVRQICSNGMVAFDSDLRMEQTHQEPLQYGMARQAVDAIVDGADTVEQRLQTAADRSFHSTDEALLGLMDLGLDAYFEEDAVSLLRESLETELTDTQDAPTMYDTYNAATRALTHHAKLSPSQRDSALERAGRLLDQHGQVPEPEPYAQEVLERRIDAVTDEAEPYWDGEEEALQELVAVHGDDSDLAG